MLVNIFKKEHLKWRKSGGVVEYAPGWFYLHPESGEPVGPYKSYYSAFFAGLDKLDKIKEAHKRLYHSDN